jgi:hypothetical protein
MFSRMLFRVSALIAACTLVPGSPAAIASIAETGDAGLDQYGALDDATLWVALSGYCQSKDPLLSDLALRFTRRRLFKTIELFGEQAAPEARLIALDRAREVATLRGLDPDVYVGLDAASTVAFDESHDPLMVVFPDGEARPLSQVSFLLGRLVGQRMSRVRLIFAEELREDIRRALS